MRILSKIVIFTLTTSYYIGKIYFSYVRPHIVVVVGGGGPITMAGEIPPLSNLKHTRTTMYPITRPYYKQTTQRIIQNRTYFFRHDNYRIS